MAVCGFPQLLSLEFCLCLVGTEVTLSKDEVAEHSPLLFSWDSASAPKRVRKLRRTPEFIQLTEMFNADTPRRGIQPLTGLLPPAVPRRARGPRQGPAPAPLPRQPLGVPSGRRRDAAGP